MNDDIIEYKNNYGLKYLILTFVICIILIIAMLCQAIHLRHKYQQIYNEGVILLESGNYEEAVEKFNEIPDCEDYRDVAELLNIKQICSRCGNVLED